MGHLMLNSLNRARKPPESPATVNNALEGASSTLRAPSPRVRGEGNKEGSYLED